jgi:pSer/pThr/pTyr-binding forkhead associated (FHA) protein
MVNRRLTLVRVADAQSFELKLPALIGRASASDLKLSGERTSRRHARIEGDGDEVSIEDLDSRSGTYLNGKRLPSGNKCSLRQGDQLTFDTECYELRSLAAPVATADVAVTVFEQPQRKNPDWLATGYVQKRLGTVIYSRTVVRPLRKAAEERADNRPLKDISLERIPIDGPCLIVLAGNLRDQVIKLQRSSQRVTKWSIGANEKREICLPDAGISGMHAVLIHDGKRWVLKDQISASGTFVNNRPCTERVLSDRDEVRFGAVRCIFRAPRAKRGSDVRSLVKRVLAWRPRQVGSA